MRSHTHANSDANPNAHCYTYFYAHSYRDPDLYANSNADSVAHTHSHPGKGKPNTATTRHAAPAADSLTSDALSSLSQRPEDFGRADFEIQLSRVVPPAVRSSEY